jgi:hypothetical protein
MKALFGLPPRITPDDFQGPQEIEISDFTEMHNRIRELKQVIFRIHPFYQSFDSWMIADSPMYQFKISPDNKTLPKTMH